VQVITEEISQLTHRDPFTVSDTSSASQQQPNASTSATEKPTMSGKYPKSCKAAVIEKVNGPLVIKDVPVEDPKEGEILIKVHACGVCHSDAFVQQGAFGPMWVQLLP